MKLFGFLNINNEAKFQITKADRLWVEDNFNWLIQAFGYPNKQCQQLELSEISFPNTFSSSQINVQNVINDLSKLFLLDPSKIGFELVEDLRDSYAIPFEIEGTIFEVDIETVEGNYKILVAKSLLLQPQRLIFGLIYEFVKIRLIESGLTFDTGEDTSLFIYLAGVYFGFGVMLSQNLVHTGRSSQGLWETKWQYVSEIPEEVLIFALALDSYLIGQNNPVWKSQLPKSLRLKYEKAVEYLNANPSDLFSGEELEAQDLLIQAEVEFQSKNFELGISKLQKVLSLTNDGQLKSEVYNDIGYFLILKGELEISMPNLLKSLELNPELGFASDNLAYTLIRMGRLEEGKNYIDRAIETKYHNLASSYGNLALYYQAKGDIELAEKNFKLAFHHMDEPLDLLVQHFRDYLIEQGREEEIKEYLNN